MKWNQLKYKFKWFIIKTNLFKHTFNVEGFIYVDALGNPVNDITEKVRWLGTADIHCYYRDMEKKVIELFSATYPQYRGYINIF